jgi:hypothetical protein
MAVGMAVKRKPRSKVPRKKATKVAATPAPPPDVEPLPGSAFSPPEVEFAARVPSPLPERTRPFKRRAIFIDVENESRAARIEQVLDTLEIDHASSTTDIIASGNWRVISHETARLLAKKGAQLVHSAPAVGVRDWSDLRIAVAAGAWLASARPGDRLDIVSADRAFDAVGDVAAAAAAAPSRRRRRGGRARAPAARPVATKAAPPPETAAAPPVEAAGAPVAAPQDEILSVVRELLAASPRGVMLDAIANRLKAQGFERPANSPRLVTRLRSMKDLRVSPRGLVMLAAAAEGRRQPATPA